MRLCVCAWNVFVLLVAWLVPQFLMLLYFMLLRRCLQWLSHDNREVKFPTAFSWLSCSSFLVAVISAYFKSVCLVITVFYYCLIGVFVFFRDHSR